MNREVGPMTINKIDGMPSSTSNSIIRSIALHLDADPENPLDVEKIFLSTNSTYNQIKDCCYAMLMCRLIKASFFPVHQDCGSVIGKSETSSFQVEDKIRRGHYKGNCSKCGKQIIPNHVSIGMNFWKFGATIK